MILPDFYKPYTIHFQNIDCIDALKKEYKESLKFYENINSKLSLHKYEKDKWSIRELLGHICDAEQIFAFRLLSIIRNEQSSLPGFDHNAYVDAANFNNHEWKNLIQRYRLIRESNLNLCIEIDKSDYSKVGNANGNDISVEALILVIAGHEKHHRKIISERYLN